MERNNSRGHAALLAVIPIAIALTACGGAVSAPSNTPSGGSPSSLSITTAASLPSGRAQTSYQTSLTATGGVSPYTWSISHGSLPAGITLDASTGQISGTPTAEGQFSFTVQAADSSQPTPQTATKALDLEIAPPLQLQIRTNALTTARIGAPYQATMTGTGGVPPYTWRLAAGLLPLGLMLGAASGDITGTPTEAGQFSITIEVQDSSQPSPQVATAGFDLSVVQGSLDLYGGSVDKQCTGGATGHFYTELINSRWWFCTPEGNVFWMLGVYEVSTFAGGTNYASAVFAKYGDARFSFCEAAVRRMKSWGFNAVAEYSSSYCTPVGQYGRPQGNPEKAPFIWLIRPGLYSANGSNCQGEGTGHVKALMKGLDRSVYKGFMPSTGGFPDVFDINFRNCAQAKADDHKTEFTNGLDNEPWLIGTTIEDTDFLFGFGPGPEFPGTDNVNHLHLSWVVFATCPAQTTNAIDCGTGGGLTYTDTTVYAKLAFRDFMQNRYGTINALNSAWGTIYTTFGSNGGWPTGSGLLDENGASFGCLVSLSCMNATMQQDFDDFLEFMSDRYFSDVVSALRAELPNKLIFGPAPLNSHQGMTRRAILRAAGRYLDVVQVQVDPDRPQIIVETYREAPIPQTSWTGYSANADSDFSWAKPAAPNLDRPTQEARGQQYATQLDMMINTATASGIFPSIGVHWWEWAGKANEQTNWGLVSQRDNAYDGKEAIIAPGTDPWGFPTGGEAADYGDAISAIRAANLALYQKLLGGIP